MDEGLVADSERRSRDLADTLKPLILITLGFLVVTILFLSVGAYSLMIGYIPIMLYIFRKKLLEAHEITHNYQIMPGEKVILTSTHQARMSVLAPLGFLLITGLYLLLTKANQVYLLAFMLVTVVSLYLMVKGLNHASEVFADLEGIGDTRERYRWDEIVSALFVGDNLQFYEILTRQGKKLKINGRSRSLELLMDAHLIRIEPADKSYKIRWKAKDRINYVPVDFGDMIGIELEKKTNRFNKPLPNNVTIPFAIGVGVFLIYGLWWLTNLK
jgi:hypothetical protein